MTLTFFSNYLNHLQTYFCDELYKYYGDDFVFVSTLPLPKERLKSGYQDCSGYAYNLSSYLNKENYERALKLGVESDIVIIGSASEVFVRERVRRNKVTFRYYERFLKRGLWNFLNPRFSYRLINRHAFKHNNTTSVLCTSAFMPNDLNIIFAYPHERYKWGYFTEVKELDIDKVILGKPREVIEIVWAARFIKWKHPEMAVKLAFELKKKGYENFHINMIGYGPLINPIRSLIGRMNLSDSISLLGSMSNKDVCNYMQKTNIFIFTSDRNEGWGVVLNEAMSNGCAVIASHEIGSVPYLVKNGYNGLIFESKNLMNLVQQTEVLINDREFRERLSRNAYQTMNNMWNPKVAAKVFVQLADSKLNGNEYHVNVGPGSHAEKTRRNYWKVPSLYK